MSLPLRTDLSATSISIIIIVAPCSDLQGQLGTTFDLVPRSTISRLGGLDRMEETLSRLITAFHILHQHQLLDEHGHISVRNRRDPSSFVTSNVPAILISSRNDGNQWTLSTEPRFPVSYNGCQVVHTVPELSEHYIHSCIYNPKCQP